MSFYGPDGAPGYARVMYYTARLCNIGTDGVWDRARVSARTALTAAGTCTCRRDPNNVMTLYRYRYYNVMYMTLMFYSITSTPATL